MIQVCESKKVINGTGGTEHHPNPDPNPNPNKVIDGTGGTVEWLMLEDGRGWVLRRMRDEAGERFDRKKGAWKVGVALPLACLKGS